MTQVQPNHQQPQCTSEESNVTTVKAEGINHIAVATRDMKGQIAFFTDVLGLPLRALYRMHGVEGAFHAFVELNPETYFAFVDHPEATDSSEIGVTHAGTPAGAVSAGVMQHVAFTVDSVEQLLALRDRIRSRGVVAIGPLDHGFCQSIYFAGPEGLVLEATAGEAIDPRAWIDPEVVALCNISNDQLAGYRTPENYEPSSQPVPQAGNDPSKPHLAFPEEVYAQILQLPDETVTQMMSFDEPPVRIDG